MFTRKLNMFKFCLTFIVLFLTTSLSIADSLNISIKFKDPNTGEYTVDLPSKYYIKYVLQAPVFEGDAYGPEVDGRQVFYVSSSDSELKIVRDIKPVRSYEICYNAGGSDACYKTYHGIGVFTNYIDIGPPNCVQYTSFGQAKYLCDYSYNISNVEKFYIARAYFGEYSTDTSNANDRSINNLFALTLSDLSGEASRECNYTIDFDYDMPPPSSDDSNQLYNLLYNNVPQAFLHVNANPDCFVTMPDGQKIGDGQEVPLSSSQLYRDAYRNMVKDHLIYLGSTSSQWVPPK